MSERHGRYYGPRAVPCECGSTDAYWHGPPSGARTYVCDRCWRRICAEAGRPVDDDDQADAR